MGEPEAADPNCSKGQQEVDPPHVNSTIDAKLTRRNISAHATNSLLYAYSTALKARVTLIIDFVRELRMG
jgi:hypothetical protein